MMEQVPDVPSQDVITKDNAVVKVDGVVFYQVLDAAKAACEVATLEIAIVDHLRHRLSRDACRGAGRDPVPCAA